MKGPPHHQTRTFKPTAGSPKKPVLRAAAHRRERENGYQSEPIMKDNLVTVSSVMSTRTKIIEASFTTIPISKQTANPQPESRISSDLLPDIPTWLACTAAIFFLLGIIMSMLLYCVNFPPKVAWSGERSRNKRHEYQVIDPHNLWVNETSRGSIYDSSPAGSGYQPKNVPSSASSTPQELHYRRNKRGLAVETRATGIGLGLEVPTIRTLSPSHRKTLPDNDAAVDELYDPAATSWRPLSASLHSDQSLLNSTWTNAEDDRADLQERDLETGLPIKNRGPWLTPVPSPAGSASSRSSSSSQIRILSMLGNGVERAADYFARVLDDQVQKGDAEGGLLLSVKDCEREQWPPLEMAHVGNAKKRC
ncbi:hypothetical protein TI39_contig354g00040 [Zymoseptoria brevis]|uniref:Uncharacterized protein n=1 Tax=Zymoseptoria brevis TaxID=1047168 RepID=A0A0F4GQF2_9PEZI|nr:hypothetical protein TI39_contig354g00040 [Zymoseptoria brevis]